MDIIRLGDQSRHSQVSWRTKDGAGKAGETYEQASGTVYFGVGDGVEPISVKLLGNDDWSAILDFQVELVADSAVNARLGHYGSKTRVKVVDRDQFPSNNLPISNPPELTTSEAKMSLPIFTLAPIDFILRGFLGDEPVGLALIDGYFLKEIHLESKNSAC